MNNPLSILMSLLIFFSMSLYGQSLQDPVPIVNADTIPNDTIRIENGIPVSDQTPAARKQHTITPVDIDDEKEKPIMHYFDIHGEPLDEPVMFLASLDTITKPKPKPIYPVYNGISIGANFFDGIMMAFGQKYASFDLWADVSIYNWFFPIIEAGIGFANSTPSNQNFTYKVNPSFYAKIGLNYNFMYKSNPDYQLFLGIRAAFSSFDWQVRDISINSPYWRQDMRFNLDGLHSTAFWGELLAGIKVKIVSNFSLGWTVRWHFPFHVSKSKPHSLSEDMNNNASSKPWFIPGYGATLPFCFTFSAVWTIPAKSKNADNK